MKKSIRFFLLFAAFLFAGKISYSQTGSDTNQATNSIVLGLEQVSLLKSNSATINLKLSPQQAGQAVQQSMSDTTARLLISSVVAEGGTRNLSASITSGTIPAGTYLRLIPMTPNLHFVGEGGTLGSEIDLSNTAQNIITGILTCYSGTDTYDGYILKYTFGVLSEAASYADIRATTGSAITVTLTLSTGA